MLFEKGDYMAYVSKNVAEKLGIEKCLKLPGYEKKEAIKKEERKLDLSEVIRINELQKSFAVTRSNIISGDGYFKIGSDNSSINGVGGEYEDEDIYRDSFDNLWINWCPRANKIDTNKEKENKKMTMCAVKSVDVYNDKAVKVTFTDGSFTRATCSDDDVFSLDTGITICLIKKIMGGSKQYNKAIKDIHKLIEKNEKVKEEEIKKKKREKIKREKALMKKDRKYMDWRNEQIEIQKEAYIRAMKETNRDAQS